MNVSDNPERETRIPIAPPKADDGIKGYARAWCGLCPGHSPRCEEIWRDTLTRASDMPDGKVWLEALKQTICEGFHKYQVNNDNSRYSAVVANPKDISCTVCLDYCPFLTIDIDMRTRIRNSGGIWTPKFQTATEGIQREHRVFPSHQEISEESIGSVAKIVKERWEEMSAAERIETHEMKTELITYQPL